MRDPFPLPLIPVLTRLSQTLASVTGLTTLPLHAHEIFYAFVLYQCIFVFLAPLLSRLLAHKHYLSLSRENNLRWRMKCVSFAQSVLISSLSLWVHFADEERAAMDLKERIWGYTGALGMVQALAVGYFVWDTFIMIIYADVFGPAMLVHGLACTLTFSLGFRPVLNYYACVFMLYELSTPLLNLHWFFDKFGMSGSKLQIYNGVMLILTFFGVRLVYGGYMSYRLYSDCWNALKVDCGTVELVSELGEKGRVPAVGNCPVPWWVLGIYLVGHVTLNSLNVYWFRAMIRAIRSRAKGARPKTL